MVQGRARATTRPRGALARRVAAFAAVCALALAGSVSGAFAATPPASSTGLIDVSPSFWDAGRIGVAVKDGLIAPLGGDFRPTWALTEGQLATALGRLNRSITAAAGLGAVVSAEHAAGQAYRPGGTVTHAAFAVALVDALGLATAAADLARTTSPWPDGRYVPTWAAGSATVMGRLGLTWGNTWAGSFEASGGVERDQAAWALVGARALNVQAIAAAVAPAVARVHLVDPPTALTVGQSAALRAQVVDAHGAALPVPVRWSGQGAVRVRDGSEAYATRAGAGELVAAAAVGAASARIRLRVSAPAGGSHGATAAGAGTAARAGAGAAGGTSAGGTGGATSSGGTGTGATGSGTSGGLTSGSATAAGTGPFPDVAAGAWYAAAAATVASSGMLPAMGDGLWQPMSVLHEAGLAGAVAVWRGLSARAAQALVASTLGSYEPALPVRHDQFAAVIAQALGLSTVAADEATLTSPWHDAASVPAALRGPANLFGHLGLRFGGIAPDAFAPTAGTSRAQAAYALVAAAALTPTALATEASRVAAKVVVTAPPTSPVAGAAVALQAAATDAHGHPVPSAIVWRSDNGTVTGQGVFTPDKPGAAMVEAMAPLSRATGTLRLDITPADPPPSALVIVPPPTAQAGQAATIVVQVRNAAGLDATDSGRTITLTVTGPGGTSTLTATDQNGVANIPVTESTVGAYTLSASSQGLTGALGSLTVEASATASARLAITAVTPASVQEGAAADFTVAVEDNSGSTVAADSGRTVTLTITLTQSALATPPAGIQPAMAGGGPGSGGVGVDPPPPPADPLPVTLTATDTGGVATFAWTAGLPGTYTVTATATGLASATEPLTVAPAPVAGIVLSASSPSVTVGETVPITATLVDAGGQPTIGSIPITVSLGAGSPGSLTLIDSLLTDTSIIGDYTAPATPGGTAVVMVASGSLPTAQLSLGIVSALPEDVPQFAAAPYTTAAGQSVDVVVDLGPSGGAADPNSNGVAVTLSVTGPAGGAAQTLTVADSAGVASFTLYETAVGNYQLSASVAGAPTATATLSVTVGPPADLALSVEPTSLLMPGQTADIAVTVTDAFGNVEPSTVTAPVTLTTSNATVGSLAVLLATAPGTAGQFTAAAGGTTTITATAPGLRTATATIEVEATRASLVSGKGMWLTWSDWHDFGAQALVATALADHIDHLYLEVATTHDGFYGTDALDALLPLAHAAHIAVIAWVYVALSNPAADAAMTMKVARYVTPSGDQVDGIAADIEAVVTPAAVGTYAASVRNALPSELFVGVTFPPLYHTSYPYAVLARQVDVIAPMDYWHSMPKAYTAAYVYSYITQSIDSIRQLDAAPTLPIAPIGQSYDMFTSSGTGPNNPTPAEITAAFDAAEADGAIGFSLYRWGTATNAEWKTWASLVWGQTPPSGEGNG